jgi:hypothetical protein
MVASATNQDRKQVGGYGFSTDFEGLSSQQVNAKLDGMKAAGATWVRFDLGWDQVQEGGPSSYEWSKYDAEVQAAQARGLKVDLIVDFVPKWARLQSCSYTKMCAPSDPSAYGRFAGAAAAHYAPMGVHTYEIWNEPNISAHFKPAADPARYTEMLKDSYTAIKQADAGATVIEGGPAPTGTDADRSNLTPTDWLQAIYDAGAAGSFDAVAAHPYLYPQTPSQSVAADAWGQLPGMHDIMSAHGDGNKLIWITEFGAPTDGPDKPGDHVSDDVQAQTLAEAAQIWKGYSWAGPLFWYDYQDASGDNSTNERFFGLVRADGSHKPSYDAFVKAAAGTK